MQSKEATHLWTEQNRINLLESEQKLSGWPTPKGLKDHRECGGWHNPFFGEIPSTLRQVKNTLAEEVMSCQSPHSRHVHEYKCKGFATRCEPLVTFKNGKSTFGFF